MGIGAAGGAGIDGRQGLDTNGKASGMNVRPTTASGHRTRACVPHTPYTLVLKFVPSAGSKTVLPHPVGCVMQPRMRLVGMQATAC